MLLNPLKTLFVNRTECYCVQLAKGYSKVSEPLTDWVLEEHLAGRITVGSYQLDANSMVKWLCSDLDPEKLADPKATAKQILNVLLETKKDSDGNEAPRVWPGCVVLEASRFPDPSYHIWLLFLFPVKAKVARWLGLRILELAGLSPKEIEVFPKQDEITPERPYGNCVKLPFGKHQVEGKWSRLLDFSTFEPVPFGTIEDKHGLSFSEADMEKLEGLEAKKTVQIAFERPETFRKLGDKDEENTVAFLTKYWIEGFRNDLEMGFLGLCIKKGVSHDSARRIIEEVCKQTNMSSLDAENALQKVDYHYKNRLSVNLKGSSGIRDVIEAIKEKQEKERKQC